jgi:hypothetical protein
MIFILPSCICGRAEARGIAAAKQAAAASLTRRAVRAYRCQSRHQARLRCHILRQLTAVVDIGRELSASQGVPIDATNHRGWFGLGVLPRLRAVQFNHNFQPRRDAIVFGETGGEFAVL